jgi:hypothetical protein
MKNIGYHTGEEIANGIDGLRPIKKTTLKNLRNARKIKYTKIGNECVYKKEWIEEYLERNEVQPIRA